MFDSIKCVVMHSNRLAGLRVEWHATWLQILRNPAGFSFSGEQSSSSGRKLNCFSFQPTDGTTFELIKINFPVWLHYDVAITVYLSWSFPRSAIL